jgi:hypothetical protein
MTEIPDKLSLHYHLFLGAYPAIYDRQIPPVDYYPSYISTYVERDVRRIQNIENLQLFNDFLSRVQGALNSHLTIPVSQMILASGLIRRNGGS